MSHGLAGDPALAAAVAAARAQVCELHAALVENGLVAWTSGNVSARVRAGPFPGTGQPPATGQPPGTGPYGGEATAGGASPRGDLMVIKPSGVAYADLTPDSMVVCDLDGNPVDGAYRPSSDTATHAYVYRHMPRVGGVVHTHSTYATAWAARGEAIPCVITAMADEFGGEIPIGPFALIGGDDIGREIVATLAEHRSPAVLMRSHGVFTIGATARDAVKAAVMCEDAARTVHLARAHGDPPPLAPEHIDALHRRYTQEYGQR